MVGRTPPHRQLQKRSRSLPRRRPSTDDDPSTCVYAALIETLINHTLAADDIRDPDLPDQHLTPARALRDLNRIRRHQIGAHSRRTTLTTRRTPLQAQTLAAIGTDTRTWDNPTIT